VRRQVIRGMVATVLAGFLAMGTSPQSQAKSPVAKTISIRISNSLPKIRPKFQIPNDPNQLMYLQRSMNANTIVYAARFLDNGDLDARNPVSVYWRRFNSGGKARALGYFERQFAFGVTVRKTAQSGTYSIEFKALPGRTITLRQTGPNQVELTGKIGPHVVQPIYLYVDLDESGLAPKVIGLSLFGRDKESGKYITEQISVSGGEITQ